MSVSPLFKKAVLGAVDRDIDVAGSALLPGAWPIVKGALDPILDRLKSQLGGDEDITASPSGRRLQNSPSGGGWRSHSAVL